MRDRTATDVGDDRGRVRFVDVGVTFLTGIEVDIAGGIVDPGDRGPGGRLQTSMPDVLVAARADVPRSDGRFYGIDAAEHGSAVIPRAMAAVRPDWLADQLAAIALPAGWRVESALGDLHDFGVGVLAIRLRRLDEADIGDADLPRLLEPLGAAVQVACDPIVSVLTDAVRRALCDDPARLDLSHGLDLETVALLPPAGVVLWRWHTVILDAPRAALTDVAERIADLVCPNDYALLEHRDHTFAAGTHASVVCSAPGWMEDGAFLAHVPRFQDAWWTLTWRLDRVLLALQLRLESSLTADRPKVLQQRADILSDVSARVALLRSRLDSHLVAGGARDLAAWETLATAWDLPHRLAVVDRKVVLLRQAYADAIDRIGQTRASRVNAMIYVFTALSVIASVISTVQFAQGAVDERLVVRLAIVLVSVIAATAAVILSLRVRMQPQRRG